MVETGVVSTTGERDATDPTAPRAETVPASARVRVRRGTRRAVYDRAVVHRVLDEGLVAHVGVSTSDGPLVLPMAYGRIDDTLYLHGALANALLAGADAAEVCVTVTSVDALVVARSPFHNSMNYRCVVVRGRGELVRDHAEREHALRAINDRLVPTWDTGRVPSNSELARTAVLGVPLDEVSAKVRRGDPDDEPADVAGPHWAGTVPRHALWGPPVPAGDLAPGSIPPPSVAALEGRPAPT